MRSSKKSLNFNEQFALNKKKKKKGGNDNMPCTV